MKPHDNGPRAVEYRSARQLADRSETLAPDLAAEHPVYLYLDPAGACAMWSRSAKALLDELNRFPNAEVFWCQEEPKNMGAWAFIQPYVDWVLDQMGRGGERPHYVGRPASAATATGLMRKHLQELQSFLDEAFAK